MAKYYNYTEIEEELSGIFEREIKDHAKKGDFMWAYRINSLKKVTFDRLEGLEEISVEIDNLRYKAETEGREKEALIYDECLKIILKKLGIECYRLVNGERIIS